MMKSFVLLCTLILFALVDKTLSRTTHISNGADSLTLVPSYARIRYYNALNDGFFGGGHLITNLHVLTVAHIIQGFIRWQIEMGSSNLNPSLIHTGATGIFHPQFNSTTLINDIGILTFQHQIDFFTRTIRPIRLPTAISKIPMENEQGMVYGFGFTDIGGTQVNQIQMAYKRVVWNARCSITFPQLMIPNHFCAIDLVQHANICWGDLGSGFIVTDRGVEYLVGIASAVIERCESLQPSAYVRVAVYREWIKEITTI